MNCPECGCEVLVQSGRRIKIDRGEVFEIPIQAVECPDCGKAFAADSAREMLDEIHSATTEPPSSSQEGVLSPSAYVAWCKGSRSA